MLCIAFFHFLILEYGKIKIIVVWVFFSQGYMLAQMYLSQ